MVGEDSKMERWERLPACFWPIRVSKSLELLGYELKPNHRIKLEVIGKRYGLRANDLAWSVTNATS